MLLSTRKTPRYFLKQEPVHYARNAQALPLSCSLTSKNPIAAWINPVSWWSVRNLLYNDYGYIVRKIAEAYNDIDIKTFESEQEAIRTKREDRAKDKIKLIVQEHKDANKLKKKRK